MNILYISYWNLSDPLTVATVFPSLRILSELSQVESIIFVNIEREKVGILPSLSQYNKVKYFPYCSKTSSSILKEKISDFALAPGFIRNLISTYAIDVMIARGAPAGALAWHVWLKVKVPFLVESFEPHAEYMLDSHVWRWYDVRYVLQKFYERQQKKYAKGLMPVANKYKRKLIDEGLDARRLFTVPCGVDYSKFAFSESDRHEVRKALGYQSDAISGIYVGRYGGLYLEDEAFMLYRGAFDYFGTRFNLILLTPSTYHQWITTKIAQFNLPKERVFVASVAHEQVPRYLSASDFGFATYKAGRSKAFLSPVKIAEYWSNGLPVLLTEGIGDETDIQLKFPFAGVLFNPERIQVLMNDYYKELGEKVKVRCDVDNPIPRLVHAFRNMSTARDGYQYFLRKEES